MIFCDKCGNLMIAEEKKGKLVYVCRNCGHTSHPKKIKTTRISEKLKTEEKKVLVINEEVGFERYPKAKIMCPKCENHEAYWFMQQTRGGDEPPTRFYCCTKCGHKWREYG